MTDLNLFEHPANAPAIFAKDGRAFSNSRDVATFFDKRHDNVLRDIDALIAQLPEGSLLIFEEATFTNTKTGQTHRSFDMTRDGFMLLAMGFTGEKALQWKLRYLQAFNAMEAELRAPAARIAGPDSALIAETVMLRHDVTQEQLLVYRLRKEVADAINKLREQLERAETVAADLEYERRAYVRDAGIAESLKKALAEDRARAAEKAVKEGKPTAKVFRLKPGRPPKKPEGDVTP